ncbi:TPA: AAA family ATPase [Citrobacter freundii]|uniref:AAA family ATPase n=1 Tax=Citrobacter portucalensis TaxID=1639133 RepID=UPI0029CDA607|nr:AAA family ATPase [Citrobacter freundii]
MQVLVLEESLSVINNGSFFITSLEAKLKFTIDTINGIDGFSGTSFKVDVGGKNLIITGNNGAGKTRFLGKIKEKIDSLFQSYDIPSLENLNKTLKDSENALATTPQGTTVHEQLNVAIAEIKRQIAALNNFNLEFNDAYGFRSLVRNRKGFVYFFPAMRSANIYNDGRITSRETLISEYNNNIQDANFDAGQLLERYIVTLWNYSLLKKANGDINDYNRVFGTITSIQDDLRELFEDSSLRLDFNLEELKIFIVQNKKEPFGMNQLSSGFSSILSVYAHLIMRAELDKVGKKDMLGIVIIDEIDAHLHVTLQKKVFSFFSNSFPNVQFIISTHSPFVLQSVSNSVIFNLSSYEQMKDLSLYSYTSIVKGLLGESEESERLKRLVNELLILVDNKNFSQRFESLINLLDENAEHLDSRSRASLALAKSKRLDSEEWGENV